MIPLDRLIVVAAPSCCGKSTFINEIRNNGLQGLARELQICDTKSWAYDDAFYIDAKFLRNTERSPTKNMVIHWTIPRPTAKLAFRNLLTLNAYDKKERVEFLRKSHEVTILTLFTSQNDLVQRVQSRCEHVRQRRLVGTDSYLNFARKRWNMWKLGRFYSNTRNLTSLYERWFGFCQTLNVRASYLVDIQGDATLVSTAKWPEIRADWLKDG